MPRKNPLFRWCRRRLRRVARILWLLWMPVGFLCDILTMSLAATGYLSAAACEWVSLLVIHITIFCAAAFYCREGAAAAAAGFTELISSLSVPAVHVVTIHIEIEYSLPTLFDGLARALYAIALHLMLTACRIGHVLGIIAVRYPVLCATLTCLHFLDLV